MKLDELAPIAIVGIFKYLAPGYLRDIQGTNKYFYGAVADTQLLGDVRYFTEGYRETARLFSGFGTSEISEQTHNRHPLLGVQSELPIQSPQ